MCFFLLINNAVLSDLEDVEDRRRKSLTRSKSTKQSPKGSTQPVDKLKGRGVVGNTSYDKQ